MCNCIELTNDALKEDGLKLAVGIVLPVDGTQPYVYLPVATERIDGKKKKSPAFVPTYCPFCGEKRIA